ncbi:unnamed protein product, partial [Symbiodinium microadriaticum]
MRMKLQSLRTQNVFDTPDVWELQAICESFGESPPEPALPSATSVASLVRSSTPDPWEWDAMLQDDKLCVPQPCMAPASLMPSGAPLGPQSEYPRPLGSPERKPSMRPGMLETSFSEGQTLVKWCVDASKFSSNSGRLVSPDFQLHFPQQEPLTFRLMVIGGKNAGFKKAKGRGSLELKCFSAVPPGLQSITACVAIGAGESQRISPKPIKHNFVEKTCCQLRNGEEASWDFKKLTGDATICEIAVEIHLSDKTSLDMETAGLKPTDSLAVAWIRTRVESTEVGGELFPAQDLLASLPLVRSHAGITRLAFLRWQMDALALVPSHESCLEFLHQIWGDVALTMGTEGWAPDWLPSAPRLYAPWARRRLLLCGGGMESILEALAKLSYQDLAAIGVVLLAIFIICVGFPCFLVFVTATGIGPRRAKCLPRSLEDLEFLKAEGDTQRAVGDGAFLKICQARLISASICDPETDCVQLRDDCGLDHLHIPTPDFFSPTQPDIEAAVTFITDHIAK